jgi:hypothetical protein
MARIHSETTEKFYDIKQDEEGNWSCGCASWRFNHEAKTHMPPIENCQCLRTCKHLRAIFTNKAHVLDRMLLYSGAYDIEIDGENWKIEEVL